MLVKFNSEELVEVTGLESIDFKARTPRDAVELVWANWPGLKSDLLADRYTITSEGQTLTVDDARMEGCEEITISPAIKGEGPAIAGAFAAIGSWWAGLGAVTKFAILVVGGLALRYVAYLLTPKPEAINPPNRDPSNPSDLISGQLPGLSEGLPVPLCYGERIIEPKIVSQSIQDQEETDMGII